jgi:hypothetical protein
LPLHPPKLTRATISPIHRFNGALRFKRPSQQSAFNC